MAGNEQLRDVDAADAAADVIGTKNRLSEKLLASPDFDECCSFRHVSTYGDGTQSQVFWLK